MRYRAFLASIGLLMLCLVGGTTDNATQTIVALQFTKIDDVTVDPGGGGMQLYAQSISNGTQMGTDAGAKSSYYVPFGYSVTLDALTVVAADTLAAADNEQCKILLETNSTGTLDTGTDVSSSVIEIGESNPNSAGICEGQTAAVTLQTRGDNCRRLVDSSDANANVAGGGWWRIEAQEPTVGDCAKIKSIDVIVDLTYLKGAS